MGKNKKKKQDKAIHQFKLDNLVTERFDEYRLVIPRQGGMRTDGVVFITHEMEKVVKKDKALEQVANVAFLPGIIGNSLAMPDIHWGYGFPIGGVAAFDADKGVVSPGGIGYDINCGVRLLKTSLLKDDIISYLPKFLDILFKYVPTGIGSERKNSLINNKTIDDVLMSGAKWTIDNGYGQNEDLELIEDNGKMNFSNPDLVSKRAKERGIPQLGTLGSGNHFVEVNFVDEIFNSEVAKEFGLIKDMVCILIHTGSRGLGHQICSESIKTLQTVTEKEKIYIPDRQLCCAPLTNKEAENYLSSMACAANFAFANRQIISFEIINGIKKIFGNEAKVKLLYDLAHNIAKWETHNVNGIMKKILVHRKGATRSFPAGHPLVCSVYKKVGQPVIIPGDMGRFSYILVGTQKGMEISFGSTCHGAGRLLSRSQIKKEVNSQETIENLRKSGILIKAASKETLIEELPQSYKDITQVIDVVDRTGISKKIAKLRPLAVIKG